MIESFLYKIFFIYIAIIALPVIIAIGSKYIRYRGHFNKEKAKRIAAYEAKKKEYQRSH